MSTWPKRLFALISGIAMQISLANIYALFDLHGQAGEAISEATLVLPWWGHAILIACILWWAYVEEVFFRSFLWRKIENLTNSTTAWIATSFLFAMAHIVLSSQEAIALLPAAFLFGMWRRFSTPVEGVYLAAFCHIGFNLFGIILSIK